MYKLHKIQTIQMEEGEETLYLENFLGVYIDMACRAFRADEKYTKLITDYR